MAISGGGFQGFLSSVLEHFGLGKGKHILPELSPVFLL